MITIAHIELFFLVFSRIAAMLFMAPFFASPIIPARLKAGLSLAIAFLLFRCAQGAESMLPQSLFDLAVGLSREVALGAALGYLMNLIFSAVMLAGQIGGFQLGFGIANVIDPMSANEVSLIALFKNAVLFLVFLSSNAHHWILWALAESFERIPLMGFALQGNHVERITLLVGHMFVIAMKISAPLIAVSIFTNVAMGLIARTVPQINVFIVGLPLQIATGLFAIGISLPFIVSYMKDLFEGMGSQVLSLLM